MDHSTNMVDDLVRLQGIVNQALKDARGAPASLAELLASTMPGFDPTNSLSTDIDTADV